MTTCIGCEREFIRMRPLQAVCSVPCARKAIAKARKAEKTKDKSRREAIKPRSKWLAEAQAAFNAWIRSRDQHLGCISCGTHSGKQNAGHYLSTGARPELRFDECNVHLQCERCNTYLHGNLIAYRTTLIQRIGMSEVDRLEGPNPLRKYTADDLKWLKAEYKSRLAAMKAAA